MNKDYYMEYENKSEYYKQYYEKNKERIIQKNIEYAKKHRKHKNKILWPKFYKSHRRKHNIKFSENDINPILKIDF